MKAAILIIAAGASRRLGQPKQLLPFKGTFLLDYIINECHDSRIGDVFVVIGANRELIESQLNTAKITVINNENWQNGIGNSIACGMAYLQDKQYDGVIIALSDQPYFNKNLLHAIIEKRAETHAPIIISAYTKGMGPPSFFEKSLFPALQQLNSDIGAKPIIQQHFNKIATILFDKGHFDIDTTEDLIYLED